MSERLRTGPAATLSVLCALIVWAITASGASAAETTAYTCVEKSGGGFAEAHCKEVSSGGKFGHVAIANGETTQATFKAVKNEELGTEVAGAAVSLTGTGLECVACHFENAGVAGAMKVVGTGRLKFTGMAVAGALGAKCAVRSDPGGVAGVTETEELKFESIATQEIKFEPVVPNVIAHFELVAIPPQKCVIAGTFTMTGTLTATTSGATLVFNVPAASGALKINGNNASFKAELTFEGGPTEAPHHPVALT